MMRMPGLGLLVLPPSSNQPYYTGSVTADINLMGNGDQGIDIEVDDYLSHPDPVEVSQSLADGRPESIFWQDA